VADRKIEILVDEPLYRRLLARAADSDREIGDVARQELQSWLGDWGLRIVRHTVAADETLGSIARQYYKNPAKYKVIAAFNEIDNPNAIHVGRELLIPEPVLQEPLPKGESPYVFGLHDRGGEHYMAWADRKGWVLVTEALGAGPNDWSSRSYQDLEDQGYGVIIRLNNGYMPGGTLPRSEQYADFAARCGNFVERSAGCHIWVIGNEMNLAVERPGGPQNGEPITPERYQQAFALCRNEIRRRAGHEKDQVVTGAIGPWNIQTAYPGNPSGDWVRYFQDMLEGLNGQVDGIAIHTYARDANPANIVSEVRMDPPFENRHKMFRTYTDFMEAIPASMRHLPVYLTETDQNEAWPNANNGWIQAAYAEINRWNSNPTHQKIRCMLLYRWEKHAGDIWWMEGKDRLMDDFRAAMQHEYRWRS